MVPTDMFASKVPFSWALGGFVAGLGVSATVSGKEVTRGEFYEPVSGESKYAGYNALTKNLVDARGYERVQRTYRDGKQAGISNHLVNNSLRGQFMLERREVYYKDEPGQVASVYYLGEHVCGHDGIVHGGLSATLIDETMGILFIKSFGPGVTANLNINYRRPIPADSAVVVRAEVDRQEGRKTYLRAKIVGTDDFEGEKPFADATGLFIAITKEKLDKSRGHTEE